ncbi:MAG TPA: DUF2079 domain-containing protein [Oligoflexia bacterium]|nr:DUF2079 domain-containing protein [Oligoflexia bacterium]HMP48947.1 DUF2079 domain-containing protein [Oligoflexia bacterium]
MKPLEKYLFLAISIAFLVLFTWSTRLRWYTGQMDNILSVSVLENIYSQGKPLFQEVGLREALSLMPLPPEDICNADLTPPENEFDSIIRWHAYFILFLLAPFLKLFSAVSLMSFLAVLSFYFLLAGSYLFLRKRQIPWFLSLAFSCLVAAHPAWSQSLLGQLYVDRLFLGLFFLLILLIDAPKRKLLAISLTSILCALVNDRLGLISGAFVFGYSILFFRESFNSRKTLFFVSLVLIAYSVLVMKFVIENKYYGGFLSILSPSAIIRNLSNDTFRGNLNIFLIINLGLFGFLGIFRWQAFLLALGLMLPNMFGSIGGAEKVGWSTHYHTTYFPVLVWASASGFSNIVNFLSSRWARAIVCLGIVFISFMQATLSPNLQKYFNFELSSLERHAFIDTGRTISGYLNGEGKVYSHADFGRQVKEIIPRGKSLSTSEYVMPLFYDHVRLFYYPIGILQADYVLLPFDNLSNGSRDFHGYFSYLPLTSEQIASLRSCLRNRLTEAGFDLENPELVWNDWALVKKKVTN